MNTKELFDLGQVSRELMRLAKAVEINNERLTELQDQVKELRERIETLEENQVKLKDAADKAFYAATKLNNTVRHLQCLEPDTSPDCPEAINEPPAHHHTLQSFSDVEEDTITRNAISAAVGAATRVAIDVVKAHKTQRPVEVSWLGWTIKAPVVVFGALVIIGTLRYTLFRGMRK